MNIKLNVGCDESCNKRLDIRNSKRYTGEKGVGKRWKVEADRQV